MLANVFLRSNHRGSWQTFCSKIFRTSHVIHGLERLRLLPGKRLLVVILAGPAEAIQQDAAGAGAS